MIDYFEYSYINIAYIKNLFFLKWTFLTSEVLEETPMNLFSKSAWNLFKLLEIRYYSTSSTCIKN